MPRTIFEQELTTLQDDLLVMGSMVEKALAKAMDALRNRDMQAAREVVRDDDIIDDKQVEIEDRCIHVIATQSPVARDLRYLLAVLHIGTELERMADYAEGIGKISLMMGDEPPLKPLIDIPRMADKTMDMMRRSLDALVERDIVLAHQVRDDDDEVDALYDQVFRELLTYMIEDPKTIKRATYLIWVAHDLERVADRATNIAEQVLFLVNGQQKEGACAAALGRRAGIPSRLRKLGRSNGLPGLLPLRCAGWFRRVLLPTLPLKSVMVNPWTMAFRYFRKRLKSALLLG